MSEISIVIPLASLAGAGNISPGEILQTLQNSLHLKKQLETEQNRADNLKKMLHLAGRNMQLILDEVQDPFDKAQALRGLSKELQDIANQSDTAQ